jgi:hypothetical protein
MGTPLAVRAPHPGELGRLCSVCQTSIAALERVGSCPACSSVHHDECWRENGGCAVYGCSLMPQTVKEVEAPTSGAWWGQDHKDCAQCGRSIRAAARRCKHCGAVFASPDPSASRISDPNPALRSASSTSLVVLLTGMIPFTAPFCLAFGGAWAWRNQDTIRKLPSTARVQAAVGLIAATASTALLFLVAMLHS